MQSYKLKQIKRSIHSNRNLSIDDNLSTNAKSLLEFMNSQCIMITVNGGTANLSYTENWEYLEEQ